MARKIATIDSLNKLFDTSNRPIYAIDAERRIVYCNPALTKWLDLDRGRILGRLVEYHSEPSAEDDGDRNGAPLADLCPPPRALAGEPCSGTLSCIARGSHLLHRQAEFIPLDRSLPAKANRNQEHPPKQRYAVLVLLAAADMSTQELAIELSGEPTSDEIHRTIRRFRRTQTSRYTLESLLGNSPAIQKVRAQVSAAVASGANTLICGPRGSGCGHVARTIHYCTANDAGTKLVPIDCEILTENLLRRAIESLRVPGGESTKLPTLLLEHLDHMSASHQSLLLAAIRQKVLHARIVATCSGLFHRAVAEAEFSGIDKDARGPDNSPRIRYPAKPEAVGPMPSTIDPALFDSISVVTIRIPPLAERLEDLPLHAQYFLEACNRGNEKQIGSLRSETLDMLSLYNWPGDLVQLHQIIVAAHRACTSHEVSPADLPAIIHHASHAAARIRPQPERIVLDQLLTAIEKEAIYRALAQAGGNKSEAAGLLGVTRPRLYRRLVQLGLAGEVSREPQLEQPKFIEGDLTD